MKTVSFRQAKADDLRRVICVTRLAYKIPYKENTLVTKPHEPKDIVKQFAEKRFFAIARHLPWQDRGVSQV
jgi:hypothetical protein